MMFKVVLTALVTALHFHSIIAFHAKISAPQARLLLQHGSAQRFHCGQTRLNDIGAVTDAVSNPDNVNFLQDTADAIVESFFGSFRSRVLGAVLGNILAGLVFKQIADFLYSLLNPPKKEELSSAERSDGAVSSAASSEPVSAKGKELPPISTQAWLKLVLCIMVDLAGDASFLLPGIGEAEDLAWAPLSAFIMKNIFNSNKVATAEFLKEILPFTDVIPLATTIWVFENVLVDSPVNKLLGLTSEQQKQTNS